MKNIVTIFMYVLLVSIIPVSVGLYLYSLNDYETIESINIIDDQFNEHTNDSVLIHTRNLLVNKKFNELNEYLEKLDKEYPNDIAKEELLFLSYSAFGIEDVAYESFFNSWINSTPNTYVPYLARGIYYYHMGWKERGHRWASETKEEQFDKMYDYFKKSKNDLDKSSSMNIDAIYSYSILMGMASTTGRDEDVEYLMKKALEINIHSLKIREKYLKDISPRWGGSYEKMAKYIKNSPLDLKANPKLKYLYGAIFEDKARVEEISDGYNLAKELYKESLDLNGRNHFTLFKLGRNSIWRKDYQSALEELSEAISEYKENPDYYYWRSFAYSNLKQYENVIEDILYAYALKPYSEKIQKRKVRIAKILNSKAYDERMKYEYDKALRLYSLALQVDLENDSIYYGIAQAHIRKQDLVSALSNIKTAIEINPNDINHYLLIDYILAKSKEWDEIISYWDKFIYLNPKNPRSYVERGGAYYHKGDIKKAVENAKISADLGNLEGKEAYEKFKHMAR